MKEINQLIEQIKNKFDLNILYSLNREVSNVPPMIRIEYNTFLLQIEMIDFIAVVPKIEDVHSIKRLQILEQNHSEPIIYIAPHINVAIQKQLIKARISYIGTDMVYLFPLLCFKNKELPVKKKKTTLSIIIQPILLHIIYNYKIKNFFEFEDIKLIFHQSDTSLYRHIRTLEDLDIIELLEDSSKHKQFRLNTQNSFNELLNKMNSPIKSTTYIDADDYKRIMHNNKHLHSGERALEEFNLSVGIKTFALYYKDIKQPQWDKSNYSTNYYEGYDELQLWHYEPKEILASSMKNYNKICVDPISLYLSLQKQSKDDVRVSGAVHNLYNYIQRNFGW